MTERNNNRSCCTKYITIDIVLKSEDKLCEMEYPNNRKSLRQANLNQS